MPIPEWSWGLSLLSKIGCLGVGVLFVVWVGWPQPPNSSDVGNHGEHLHNVNSTLEPQQGHETSSIVSLVDINRGTRRDLESLPGIGPVLAERILTYREMHGSFQHMEDLDDVPGIGPKRLQHLRSVATVGM